MWIVRYLSAGVRVDREPSRWPATIYEPVIWCRCIREVSATMYEPAGVRVSMHPYQWSREVCVIANYITLWMVSRPCPLDGTISHL